MTTRRIGVEKKFKTLLITLVGLALFFAFISVASAQSEEAPLSLIVNHPDNDQILYAGPEAPRYIIPVIGKVTTSSADVASIQVEVRVMKDSKLVSQIGGHPDKNGEFQFAVSPNPDATIMSLPSDKKSCETCHGVTMLAGLPAGDSIIQVIATDPQGNQAKVERYLYVDISRYIELEVDTHWTSGDIKKLEGVPIVAKTTFPVEDNPAAKEQTRYFKGNTDANGRVVLNVEARNAFPTEYHIYAPETIVSGAKISSPEEVSLIVSPQAKSAGAADLAVQGLLGQITGTIAPGTGTGMDALQVYAIEKFNHQAYQTKLNSDVFTFTDLLVSEYVVGFSRQALAVEGLASSPVVVDLIDQPHELIMIDLNTTGLSYINGSVQSEEGTPLTFAWIKNDASGEMVRLSPLNGEFTIGAPNGEVRTISVIAPGFWSRKWVVGAEQSAESKLVLSLNQQPDVTLITGKDGRRIYIPPTSVAIQESEGLKLSRGWVWGKVGSSKYNLYLRQNHIVLDASTEFAVEYLADKPPWLLIRTGFAKVEMIGQNEPVEVVSGEMLILQDNPYSAVVAIRYDPVVFDLMHSDEGVPLDFNSQPTISALIHNGLVQLGIGAIQGITLLTYVFVVFSTLVFPLLVLVWWLRKRFQSIRS